MRKKGYIIVFIMGIVLFTSCFGKKSNGQVTEIDSTSVEDEALLDSTIYGICGEGTSMHSLELLTDSGDTLTYEILDDGLNENLVVGGLLVGDRLAVVGYMNSELQEYIANKVINLTTLQGKWMSIDKNFEIQEGGIVKSNIKAETAPWVSWKIYNGKLLLNKDTFQIEALGADSLYLENRQGIFTFKRQK